MAQPVLYTRDLTIGYRSGKKETPVLAALNIGLNRGEMVSLIGSNGVGKSTLLRTLTGVQYPLSGEVAIDGRPVARWSNKELARKLGIVYTDRTLAGALTVEELVSLGRQPYTGLLGRLSREDRLIAAEAIDLVGIGDKRHRHIAALSDGERQKAMIAKALAQQTPIIIMDEPTAFLDAASRLETMALLRHLAADQGKAILLSTHDIAPALDLSDRIWMIRGDGRFLCGTPAQLSSSPDGLPSLFEGRNVRFDPAASDFKACL